MNEKQKFSLQRLDALIHSRKRQRTFITLQQGSSPHGGTPISEWQGWCDGWAFVPGPAFASALDITLSERSSAAAEARRGRRERTGDGIGQAEGGQGQLSPMDGASGQAEGGQGQLSLMDGASGQTDARQHSLTLTDGASGQNEAKQGQRTLMDTGSVQAEGAGPAAAAPEDERAEWTQGNRFSFSVGDVIYSAPSPSWPPAKGVRILQITAARPIASGFPREAAEVSVKLYASDGQALGEPLEIKTTQDGLVRLLITGEPQEG